MNRILPFAIALIFLSIHLSAQTNVGGTLASNANWTVAGSPYNLIGNVGVPSGITLTIDPGVTVNFNTTHQIVVQGTLNAAGNNGSPIIFNGNAAGSAMILFQFTNLNNSSLSYITMYGPKYGVQLSNNTADNNTGTLTIDHLTMDNSTVITKGYDSNAILIVNNSFFNNSSIRGDYPRSEVIHVNNSIINGGNVASYAYNHGVFLFNDSATNVQFEVGCCNGNLHASGCSFTNSTFIEDLNSQPGYNNYLIVDNSRFHNSGIDMHVSTVNVAMSTFDYDATYSHSYCLITGNGTITHTSFNGNGSLTAIQRGPSSWTYDNNDPYTIANCTFLGFETDIRIEAGTQSNSGSGPVSITCSDFLDFPTTYMVRNNSTYDISAFSNWWNTTNTSTIDNYIYDYWEDILNGQVFYAGYLSAPCNPSTDINSPEKANDIVIYPNPFHDNLFIKTSLSGYDLKIFNSMGQEIDHLPGMSNYQSIDVKNLSPGIYMFRLQKGDDVIGQRRVIKE